MKNTIKIVMFSIIALSTTPAESIGRGKGGFWGQGNPDYAIQAAVQAQKRAIDAMNLQSQSLLAELKAGFNSGAFNDLITLRTNAQTFYNTAITNIKNNHPELSALFATNKPGDSKFEQEFNTFQTMINTIAISCTPEEYVAFIFAITQLLQYHALNALLITTAGGEYLSTLTGFITLGTDLAKSYSNAITGILHHPELSALLAASDPKGSKFKQEFDTFQTMINTVAQSCKTPDEFNVFITAVIQLLQYNAQYEFFKKLWKVQ